MALTGVQRTLVADLPRRVAHALYGLVTAERENGMPATAYEACIYDGEALSPRHTSAALRQARKLGLAVFSGRYWLATPTALDLHWALEDRYLRETGGEAKAAQPGGEQT